MNREGLLRAVCILVLLVPLAVTSTPPTNLLKFYRVRGQVQDGSGVPVGGVPVALAADCHPDGFVLLSAGRNDCGYVYPDRGSPAAVTDSDGAFYLDVVATNFLGTLAVAIVYPDTFLVGSILDHTHNYTVNDSVPRENEGFFCSDSIEYDNKIVGQAYVFAPDTLVLATPTD